MLDYDFGPQHPFRPERLVRCVELLSRYGIEGTDPGIACSILRERFQRVAYVDIDLHHGDGVQWIWYDDPTVLTCSIHESGRTLFPGTGFSEETGARFTALNIPLDAYTTGDVWLDAFRRGILPALERFQPE